MYLDPASRSRDILNTTLVCISTDTRDCSIRKLTDGLFLHPKCRQPVECNHNPHYQIRRSWPVCSVWSKHVADSTFHHRIGILGCIFGKCRQYRSLEHRGLYSGLDLAPILKIVGESQITKKASPEFDDCYLSYLSRPNMWVDALKSSGRT